MMSFALLLGFGTGVSLRTKSFDFTGMCYGCIILCSMTWLEVSINVSDLISHLSKPDSLVDPQKEGAFWDRHSLVTGTTSEVRPSWRCVHTGCLELLS